jgi:hypothetical protein
MRKLIGKIRRQPKQRRDNIAFGIAASFTFAVVAIWMFSVPDTFSGVLSATDSAGEEEAGFFDTLSSQAAAVKESFSTDNSNSSTTESLNELMDEYRASSAQASSTQSTPVRASSTASTTPAALGESREQFTTDTSYGAEKPREVRIQAVAKATTSTTTSE